MNVDAFVVLKSGNNIKLGLMEVGVIERSQFVEEMQVFLTNRDQEIALLKEKSRKHDDLYQEYKKSSERIQTNILDSVDLAKLVERKFKHTINSVDHKRSMTIHNLVKKGEDDFKFEMISGLTLNTIEGVSEFNLRGSPQKAIDIMNANSSWDKYLKLEKNQIISAANMYISQLNEIRSLKKEKQKLEKTSQFFDGYEKLRSLESVNSLFEELPDFTASKKTNADGICQIKLPKSGEWIMFSKFTRLVGDKKEDYFWIVLQNTSESDNSLTLSNDNMIADDQIPRFLYQK